jgi:hypothetical protein
MTIDVSAESARGNPPPLAGRRPPRCPPFIKVSSPDDLLPYLRNVAERPYSQGLHPAWDLQPGERVLVQVDNWHDPLCIAAIEAILKEKGCNYVFETKDRGPIPTFAGHNEVEFFIEFTRELAELMDRWAEIERTAQYDKILWGFGGPILGDAKIRVQRLPFITPEMCANPAHMMPIELLEALDEWTWNKVTGARRIHITDPEGTNLSYTNHDEYYDADRRFFNPQLIEEWFPQNQAYAKRPLGGHIWGKPWVFLDGSFEDGEGVIAGTMNHIGPHEAIRMTVKDSLVQEITGGGEYGDKLRAVQERTKNDQFPGHPSKGLLHWWEASIGTNPKIHRPREDYMQGWCCGLYERMRSGVVHIGFGTIVSSEPERDAIRQGLEAGHFHVHLYFPTVTATMADGTEELIIDEGHLTALDAPEIREIAAKYGDPDVLLSEDWIPAIPGLNMDGDYQADYAADPMDWTMTELHVCRKWHNLYMKMISSGEGGNSHHH